MINRRGTLEVYFELNLTGRKTIRVKEQTEMDKNHTKTIEALNSINRILTQLDDESRRRVLDAVITFFQVDLGHPRSSLDRPSPSQSVPQSPRPQFRNDETPSPKEFLLEKQPKTDVERIACLAYYLTHFRDTPYFKTLDLSKLNTEAAQTKFSNANYAANNATNSGYLAAGPKGQRQISAAGEIFVVALPDRDAAKQAISLARRRKNSRKKK